MRQSALRAAVLPLVWLAIYAIGCWLSPESFLQTRNLETIFRQTVIVGFAAIGMTFVIMAAMIDLSIGSVIAMATVAAAWLMRAGYSPISCALGAVLAGLVCGLINGLAVTRLHITSFIVTLATLLAVRGVAKGIAEERKINADITWINELTAALSPERKWMLLPLGGWIVIASALIAAFMLRRTVFGRNVIAVGSNPDAAHLAGVSVPRTQMLVFLLAGIFVGLAGLAQFARLTVGDPTVAVGMELNVIAAVVIGGASLTGGTGSIFGSLVGALIMTTIGTLGGQLGWPNWTQEIVTAGIILVAVALDRLRHRRS